jgi:hypothetical protein
MCDGCGTVFSEREEGWSTQSGSMFKTDEKTGRRTQIEVDQDLCGDCTELRMSPRRAIAIQTNPRYDHEVKDATEVTE